MKKLIAYSTPTEAHLALMRLASAGIDATIRDEFIVTFDWLCSDAVGGVKIDVVEEDFAAAREVLDLPPQENGLLACPFCGSQETSVRVLSAFGAVCMMLKLPIPVSRAAVDCRNCKKTHMVAINGKKKPNQTPEPTAPSGRGSS